MEAIKASELVLASDGSLYHIHLTGDTLADDVILVGDPNRVNMFKDIFDSIEHESQSRELHALTGLYQGHRFTALSTGMGTDNIDIVMTELDACANMDLQQRTPRPQHRTLNLVRIGTSGSLHADIPCGCLVASQYAIGLDGLLNYYQHDDALFEMDLQQRFVDHMQLPSTMATPYAVACSKMLMDKVGFDMHRGITATAPGFYAPQGRHVRIAPSVSDLNERLQSFRYGEYKITNFEMECSAIFGLSKVMGHNALTVCLIIANREDGTFISDYHDAMRTALGTVMERLAQ
ncbi:MAG: nucleoside phosphorylase [Bacteroidales bacterium]|nr:nucleoside phosphorylase [Bacteroidales bacterium]